MNWIIRGQDFFNNATIAALMAVVIGSFIAERVYKKQKKMDRESDVKLDCISSITELQQKCNYALLSIDRTANSYSVTTRSDKEFFVETLQKYELPRLSNAINDEIPAMGKAIKSKIEIYFLNNSKITTQYKKFGEALKIWHEPIATIKFDFRKRVSEQKGLSLENFNLEVKELIKLIWEQPVSW